MIEFAMLRLLTGDPAASDLVLPSAINPAKLSTDRTNSQAILGMRVYAQQLPQESVVPGAPAACYIRVSTARGMTTTGPDGSVKAITTIHVVGDTYGDIQAGCDAIRKVLNGFRGTVKDIVLQDTTPPLLQDVRIGFIKLEDERDTELLPIAAQELSKNQRQMDFHSLFWEAI